MLRMFPFRVLCVLRVVVWLCGCVALFPDCGVALLPARSVDLRAQGEGVVEYLGKVACPSGRRCSTRNAVWCHSHPGFKSQRYRHCRPAPMGPGGFVMPTRRVWGACGAAGVAGWRRWCCWVAPLVFRAPDGPAAREARASLRSAPRLEARPCPPVPPALSTPAAHAWCVVSKPGQAPPSPTGTAARPSAPSGALHTSGAWCAVGWLGASARSPSLAPGPHLPHS